MALGNTSVRILVSLIAIPLIIALCLAGGIFFLLLALFIGLVSFHEFSSIARHKAVETNRPIGFAAVFMIILNAYINYVDSTVLFAAIAAALMLAEMYRQKGSALNNIGNTFFGVIYTGLFTSLLVSIREMFADPDLIYSEGGYIIITLLATIWVCDSAAFFVGSAIGKHKLFPRVSPKKSWEGAIAGFIFSIVTVIAFKYLLLDTISWFDAVMLGIIIGSAGQMGDLAESLLKRDAGVKDSSNLIPGHGGILDRFDSLLIAGPLVYIYLYYAISF